MENLWLYEFNVEQYSRKRALKTAHSKSKSKNSRILEIKKESKAGLLILHASTNNILKT